VAALKARAVKNLTEAVRLFLEEADKLGTLEQDTGRGRIYQAEEQIGRPEAHQHERMTLASPTRGCKNLALFPYQRLCAGFEAEGFRCVREEEITWCEKPGCCGRSSFLSIPVFINQEQLADCCISRSVIFDLLGADGILHKF